MPIPTDTFWNIKRLNVVFAASAVLLLAVTGWSILQDYNKDWREQQRSARVWDLAVGAGTLSPLGKRPELRRPDSSPSSTLDPSPELEVRIWDVSPRLLPAEDFQDLGELLASHQIDDSGGEIALPSQRLIELRQVLGRKYPDDFATSAEEQRTWRRGQPQPGKAAANGLGP